MTPKRINLLAGTILGAALLVGTAGVALAQDPTSTSPAAVPGISGGMMGGQTQGMMGGQSNAANRMADGRMSGMASMHAAMGRHGAFHRELMQTMHDQYNLTR